MWPKVKMWDVVLCKFPLEEYPNQPGDKYRPALVLGADDHPRFGQLLRVIYGTSQKLTPKQIGQFVIDAVQTPHDLKLAGLSKSTKFILSRRAVLPYTNEYFVSNPKTTTPRLGQLSASMQKRAALAFDELMKR